jgi:hypothetical protein
VPTAVFSGSIEFEDFWCHRHVKVSKCVSSISILNKHIFVFFCSFLNFFESKCHIVTQCDTCPGCHTCVRCHTYHKYQCHLLLVNKLAFQLLISIKSEGCVGGWVGQKVIPRPLADYFVVSRRQKLEVS